MISLKYMYFKVLELCTSFLFEPCILRYLKYIWKKNFPCNFTIYFYDPSLYYIFRIVSKMCFWQPWIQHLYLRNILGVNPLGCLFGPVPILERIFRKKSSRKFVWVQCVYLEKKNEILERIELCLILVRLAPFLKPRGNLGYKYSFCQEFFLL
jgi:hypothetical protein